MSCQEAWQDVFLTKPESGHTAQSMFDDCFVAPVMSVDVQREKGPSATQVYAKPCKGGSKWLALAFPGNAGTDEIARWRDLAKGDMIRVNTTSVGGFHDYLTIMETVDCDRLYNTSYNSRFQVVSLDPSDSATTWVVNLPIGGTGAASASSGQPLTHLDTVSTGNNFAVESENRGLPTGSLRCIRVNHELDATTLDTYAHRDAAFTLESTTANYVTDATRGEISSYYPVSGTRPYEGADRREMFYYPCYRLKEWVNSARPTSTLLRLQMPSNIKQVRAIKLMGYSLNHKQSIGTHQQHEAKQDDWIAIRIKEVRTNNNVLSNNRHADGALHVISCNTDANRAAGSTWLYAYEPQGLACVNFSPVNLPAITAEVVDRQGDEAHFGRMHLWLRVLATHN